MNAPILMEFGIYLASITRPALLIHFDILLDIM